jgi:hypothetical protein
MTMRKPRLDWIKEVLAGLEDAGEPAPAPLTSLRIVSLPATAPADLQPMNDRAETPKQDDRCPSWPLVRRAVAQRA